jgi:hypothetical protein
VNLFLTTRIIDKVERNAKFKIIVAFLCALSQFASAKVINTNAGAIILRRCKYHGYI